MIEQYDFTGPSKLLDQFYTLRVILPFYIFIIGECCVFRLVLVILKSGRVKRVRILLSTNIFDGNSMFCLYPIEPTVIVGILVYAGNRSGSVFGRGEVEKLSRDSRGLDKRSRHCMLQLLVISSCEMLYCLYTAGIDVAIVAEVD